MSVAELKSKIINRVNVMEDEQVLEEIYQIISPQSESSTIHYLSASEKNAIAVGLKDIEDGKVVNSEDANRLIREWLKK